MCYLFSAIRTPEVGTNADAAACALAAPAPAEPPVLTIPIPFVQVSAIRSGLAEAAAAASLVLDAPVRRAGSGLAAIRGGPVVVIRAAAADPAALVAERGLARRLSISVRLAGQVSIQAGPRIATAETR